MQISTVLKDVKEKLRIIQRRHRAPLDTEAPLKKSIVPVLKPDSATNKVVDSEGDHKRLDAVSRINILMNPVINGMLPKALFSGEASPEEGLALLKSIRDIVVGGALTEQLILDADPLVADASFVTALAQAGGLANKIREYHEYAGCPLIYSLVRDCFLHVFWKGAESAFLIKRDRQLTMSFDLQDAFAGRISTANVDESFAREVLSKGPAMDRVFECFKANLEIYDEQVRNRSYRAIFNYIAGGLYWSCIVGAALGVEQSGLSEG